jgi:cobalt-zinc-cadmium efflux system outer membrane protein
VRNFAFWCWLTIAAAPWAQAQAPAENPAPAPAAKPPIQILTLSQAKQMAFERNWDLLAAKSDVDLATAQKIISHEFPNPTFSWSTMKINTDRGNGTSMGNGLWDRSYDTIAAFNQLFEIGGKRASRQSSARAGYDAAVARLEDAHRTLDLAVTKAYLAALLAETNVSILRASAGSLRKEAAIADTRLKAGDISAADKSQIDIAADRLELDATTAETAAASARIALEVLLGVKDAQGTWAPGDTLEALASLPFTRQEGAPGASRPDLVAAQAALRKAEADLKLQKAMRIPDPTLMVMYEHEPPDTPNTIGLGLSFPVPLWNRNRGAIQAATASRDSAALQVEKTRAGIAAEVTTASLTYADASARLRRQRDEIQPKAAQIKNSIEFAFQRGGASLLDLLLAERNDNDIRQATAQAMADAANAAAALKAALNLPDANRSQK